MLLLNEEEEFGSGDTRSLLLVVRRMFGVIGVVIYFVLREELCLESLMEMVDGGASNSRHKAEDNETVNIVICWCGRIMFNYWSVGLRYAKIRYWAK